MGMLDLPLRNGKVPFEKSETKKNLIRAFAGESQARNRYTFAAGKAKKEGYELLEKVFLYTADQEKEHAERFFKFLEGGTLTVNAEYPAGVIGTTASNLAAAADGEYDEWHRLYPGFAEIARQEGFPAVAEVFDAICVSERHHERRYREFLKNIEASTVFVRQKPVVWKCRNCGYVILAKEAPIKCPACAHAQAYFEPKKENY